MNPLREHLALDTRRQFFGRSAIGIGTAALGSLLNRETFGGRSQGGLANLPHFAPKAKRVIYLFMSGGPSHVDTFDHKPELQQLDGQPIPASFIALTAESM